MSKFARRERSRREQLKQKRWYKDVMLETSKHEVQSQCNKMRVLLIEQKPKHEKLKTFLKTRRCYEKSLDGRSETHSYGEMRIWIKGSIDFF